MAMSRATNLVSSWWSPRYRRAGYGGRFNRAGFPVLLRGHVYDCGQAATTLLLCIVVGRVVRDVTVNEPFS